MSLISFTPAVFTECNWNGTVLRFRRTSYYSGLFVIDRKLSINKIIFLYCRFTDHSRLNWDCISTKYFAVSIVIIRKLQYLRDRKFRLYRPRQYLSRPVRDSRILKFTGKINCSDLNWEKKCTKPYNKNITRTPWIINCRISGMCAMG